MSMDLSKAFDRVHHDQIIKAMHDLGYDAYRLNFIASFLYNRQYFVEHRRHRSRIISTNCGVPQGTVLWPVLFNIVYDALQLPETINGSLSNSADDGNVLIPVDEHVKKTIEEIVKHINDWCERNNFLLNVNKTKFMMIYHGRPDEIDIRKQIESSRKILSVTFDPKLNFASHVESVRNRASQNLYLLYKLKCLGYEKKELELLYKLLFLSVLTYFVSVWDGMSQAQLNKLDSVQRKAAQLGILEDFKTMKTIPQERDACFF